MDLEKYRTLLTVIEAGSLSAAAEITGYTPSGISRMMESLEKDCGFKLLLRSRDGVAATSACQQLLPAIQDTLYYGKILKEKQKSIAGLEEGTVVLGSAYASFYPFLADLIRDFHDRHPGIIIELRDGRSSRLLEEIEGHNIDMAVTSRREGSFCWNPIGYDSMLAWIPAAESDIYLSERRTFPAKQLEKCSYIDIYPDLDSDNSRYFAFTGIQPRAAYTTRDSQTALQMVRAGLGVAINNALNSWNMGEDVLAIPLDPSCQVEIGLAVSKHLSPAAEAFAREVMPVLCKCAKVILR